MNSLSSHATKVMNLILKPYEKSMPDQFVKLLSSVSLEKEQIFLCLVSIMVGSPNCVNHSFVYISRIINNRIENKSDSLSKHKSTKSKHEKSSDSQISSNLSFIAPEDFPTCLSQEIIIDFWNILSLYLRSKKDTLNTQINLNAFIDLIPTFFNDNILNSLLTLKDSSFLIINYIKKLKNKNLEDLSKIIIENGTIDQIKLFIPYIVSNESSPLIIENWIRKYISKSNKHCSKYDFALASALSSYQCVQLLPTTIDLIVVNFFNGRYQLNSHIFESFVFYIQKNVRLFDRTQFSTEEDFIMTFFSTFILLRRNLFKSEIVCPNMFTKMINKNIPIPPFALTLFFRHLDDFILKYIAKQFIVNKSFFTYLKRCYEKSLKTGPNSYSRKILDYSIMALFLKTSSSDPQNFPIVAEMASKIKMPREEFSHFIFTKIARMFSNPANRGTALSVIEGWKNDDVSLITRTLLSVFSSGKVEALSSVEQSICKRGGHALTALFNLASSPEFVADKRRRSLLVTVVQRLVAKINVAHLRARSYMPKKLFEFISEKSENEIDQNSPQKPHARSKSRSRQIEESNDQKVDDLANSAENNEGEKSVKAKSRSNSRKPENNGLPEEQQPLKAKQRTRTVSTSNLDELKVASQPIQPQRTRARRSKHSIEPELETRETQNSQSEVKTVPTVCKLTNEQIQDFLVAQITSKSAGKADTKEVVRQIIDKINSLDRRHSRHRRGRAGHVHRKQPASKDEEQAKVPPPLPPKAPTPANPSEPKVVHPRENETGAENAETAATEANDVAATEATTNSNDNSGAVDDGNKDEAQIGLPENEGSGLYSVVGSVMKMLFGGFASQAPSKSYRSSLPIQGHGNSEIGGVGNDNDNVKANYGENQNLAASVVKTEPVFEEIDISSDEGLAFPDEDYSSTSSSGYSHLDLSDFDFDISDNGNLLL